jgi:hypothetical protein
MTGSRDQDHARRERKDERRVETDRRADKLRQSWRERHPSEEEDEKRRPTRTRPNRGKP